MRVSLGSGVDKMRALLIYALRSVKALSHYGVQVMLRLLPLRTLKKGEQLSVALEMNLVRAATHPVRLWMSFTVFGTFMSKMARIFSRLAQMPHWLIMKSRNLPEAKPKAHYVGRASTGPGCRGRRPWANELEGPQNFYIFVHLF